MEKDDFFTKPRLQQVEDLTIQLLEANKKIKAEQEERNRMLSDIAHDLRAPVSAFRSTLDYIISMRNKDSLPDDELDNLLGIMDKRTSGLQTLISDLYFLLTLEQQAESIYHFEQIELGTFLEEYYYDLELRDDMRERKLYLDVPVNLNCIVNIDTEKMVRVLDNLFSNAVKYSENGDSIGLILHELSDKKVVFCIKDTGIGIEEDNVDKIFNHSYQVAKARTPDAKTGSGLGLTIVKTIIEQHGGNIRCSSKPGEGSSFFIELSCNIQ